MQKLLTSQLALLVFCFTTSAQVKIINRDALHPDSSLLFLGVENRILVTGPATEYNLSVTSGSASIAKISGKEFVVKVANTSPVTIVASGAGSRDQKTLLTKKFTTDTLTPFEGRMAGSEDTLLSVAHILANPMLVIAAPKSQYKPGITIFGFELIIVSSGDTLPVQSVTGNAFSRAHLEQIKKLASGDQIILRQIRGERPDGRTILFPPVRIHIK